MSETGLANVSAISSMLAAAGQSKYATEEAALSVTKVGDWLPYMTVEGSNSKNVKQKKIQLGVFGLVEGKSIIDLGEEVVCVVLAWRPKAAEFEPKVLSFYDVSSDEFKKIQARAELPGLNNAACGPEFLIWLPERQKLCTFHFGNKSMRMEAPNLLAGLKDPANGGIFQCRLFCKYIEKPKFSWHCPETKPFKGELTSFPDAGYLQTELTKFLNPPQATEQAGEKDEAGEDADRR